MIDDSLLSSVFLTLVLAWLIALTVDTRKPKHESLIAAVAILTGWGVLVTVGHYYLSPPTDQYFAAGSGIGTFAFAVMYFYRAGGKPLLPAVKTTMQLVFALSEIGLSIVLSLMAGILSRVLGSIIHLVQAPDSYYLSGILIAIVAMMLFTSVAFIGDGVTNLLGKGRKVVSLSFRRGKSPVNMVNCLWCKSRYPAGAEDIEKAKSSPDHTIPCRYCGKTATIIVEYV